MRRRLVLRARTVVSEASRFGRGWVSAAGESHTTCGAVRELSVSMNTLKTHMRHVYASSARTVVRQVVDRRR
jgi:hypothetical protein